MKKNFRMAFKSMCGASDYGEMPLDFLISRVNEIKKEMEAAGLTSLSFDMSNHYINFYGYRDETDEEYQKRLASERRQKEWKREEEVRLLNELLEKYGVPEEFRGKKTLGEE